ncbi:hypothetical protein GQ457_03G004540 [Hibiscus cannabinus]
MNAEEASDRRSKGDMTDGAFSIMSVSVSMSISMEVFFSHESKERIFERLKKERKKWEKKSIQCVCLKARVGGFHGHSLDQLGLVVTFQN